MFLMGGCIVLSLCALVTRLTYLWQCHTHAICQQEVAGLHFASRISYVLARVHAEHPSGPFKRAFVSLYVVAGWNHFVRQPDGSSLTHCWFFFPHSFLHFQLGYANSIFACPISPKIF